MDELIGRTLGKYRVLNQVGRGGMAVVFKAYQPSLDRSVAIKVLPPFYVKEDETFLKRFRREAQAVAKLRHPNILMVLDFGEQDDITYIVMEYVETGTLSDRLGQPLELDEIVKIINQVASAIDYAHDQGIIHRDIKPSNILLPKPQWPLLTDFGLAKMVGGTQITQTGIMTGTPAYMSPEQGRGEKVDARTDIYSLGIVLYEMATGGVPFSAETPMSVVVKHIIDPLPLPRSRNPDLPESIERVILKALAKAPEDRFQRAGEMAVALQEAVSITPPKPAPVLGEPSAVQTGAKLPDAAGQPVRPEEVMQPAPVISGEESVAAGPRRGLMKRFRLRRGVIAAALGVLAVMAIILMVGPNLSLPPMDIPVSQVEQKPTRTVDQHIADGRAYLTKGDFETAINEFEAALAQDPKRHDVYWDIAQAYVEAGKLEEAFDTIKRAIKTGPEEAWLYESAGRFSQEMGYYQEAVGFFERALEIEPGHDGLYFALADTYEALGQPEQAARVFEDMLSAGGGDDPGRYESIGWQYMHMGSFDEAEAAFEKAVELDPESFGAWSGLIDLHWKRDDPEGAIEVVERALEIHPDQAFLHEQLGHWYWGEGELEAAEAAFGKAIEVDPTYTSAYNNLAEIYRNLGREEQALELLQGAIEADPDNPKFYDVLARFYRDSGQAREAIPYFIKALELDPDNGWTYIELARAYQLTGQRDKITPLLEEAGSRSHGDPGLLESIGSIYVELGDCDQAIKYFYRALELQPDYDQAREGLKNCGE